VDLPHVPAADWAGYSGDDSVRERCLNAVARYGCVLLRGVPATPGMVATAAETFGYVRETNYGRLFDVRVVPDPANLAFTSRRSARGPTTRTGTGADPPAAALPARRRRRGRHDPGRRLRRRRAACRRSGVVRRGEPNPVPFGYIDKETELTALQPLITLSPRGRIACVRLNNRSMRAPRLPLAQAVAVYTATGERHLQGCYADLDGLLSTLAVLRRARESRAG
jgi:gamma-butyrobetaine dioxygenase